MFSLIASLFLSLVSLFGVLEFTNPVGSANFADPCVVWDGVTKYYYLLVTHSKNVTIQRAKSLLDIPNAESKVVYVSTPEHGIHGYIWAPEMHKAPNGKWYIYTSGSAKPKDPWGKKHLFVLESKTHDPFDGFVFKGKLETSEYAIDPTIYTLDDGKQYASYSVLKPESQYIIVREMANPWTFDKKMASIAAPQYDWEKVLYRVNEGPFFVKSPDGKRLFIVFSANGCWSDDYSLGVIEYMGGDLCDAKSWKKHPDKLLYKGNGVYGTGHASFFKSPSGKELWCAYHAFDKSNPSAKPIKRLLNFQRVNFTAEGFPVMGKAIGNQAQALPEGDLGSIKKTSVKK